MKLPLTPRQGPRPGLAPHFKTCSHCLRVSWNESPLSHQVSGPTGKLAHHPASSPSAWKPTLPGQGLLGGKKVPSLVWWGGLAAIPAGQGAEGGVGGSPKPRGRALGKVPGGKGAGAGQRTVPYCGAGQHPVCFLPHLQAMWPPGQSQLTAWAPGHSSSPAPSA